MSSLGRCSLYGRGVGQAHWYAGHLFCHPWPGRHQRIYWPSHSHAEFVATAGVVPYIGAAVVTIPVAAVAFVQWGWSSEFYWLLGVYALIQALDGNVLVPLLFSEVVNLHPVAIIVAVLLFGGIWGFWGVFFAIPLATLFKAVVSAWPVASRQLENAES